MVEGETRALRRKEYRCRKVLGTYSTSKHHNGVLSANRCMFEISSFAERRMLRSLVASCRASPTRGNEVGVLSPGSGCLVLERGFGHTA